MEFFFAFFKKNQFCTTYGTGKYCRLDVTHSNEAAPRFALLHFYCFGAWRVLENLSVFTSSYAKMQRKHCKIMLEDWK